MSTLNGLQRLRIALVLEATTGGAARHVLDLSQAMIMRGHEVSLVYSPTRADAWFVKEAAQIQFTHLTPLPMGRAVSLSDLYAACKLHNLLSELGPFDIVHGHSSKAGALARLAAPRGSTRIYTPHALRTMDPQLRLAGRLTYGVAEAVLGRSVTEAIIAVSPEETIHARRWGLPSPRLYTVVNGVTPAPKTDRSSARARLGVAHEDVIVGFVGRLCEQKDPVRFARAIRIARSRHPRIRGLVFGDGHLAQATRDEGGSAVSIFAGLNAREYFAALDVFALTSSYEAMPYVLMEAIQAGLPIVSTMVGGTSVTVQNGKNGILVPVEASPDIVATAVLSATDPARNAAMARASLVLSTTVGIDEMAQKTEIVYRAAIRDRKPRPRSIPDISEASR